MMPWNHITKLQLYRTMYCLIIEAQYILFGQGPQEEEFKSRGYSTEYGRRKRAVCQEGRVNWAWIIGDESVWVRPVANPAFNLRKCDGGFGYKSIGEIYVHGGMDVEAVDGGARIIMFSYQR